MKENLLRVLRELGKEAAQLRSQDGSQTLMLPHGGRVIGLYAPDDSRNFLWTNPALGDLNRARSFFDSPGWHNIGGDRTWLAPEIDFFFPHYPVTRPDTYQPPCALDPGAFRVEPDGGAINMTSDFELIPSRTGHPVAFRLGKSVTPAANPLRREAAFLELESLQYAGYTLRTRLEIPQGNPSPNPFGLWNLLQMPHGGEMILPTTSATWPRIFFGDIPGGDLRRTAAHVHYLMRADGAQKIALRAAASTGRIGYIHRSRDEVELVVRNFFVSPSDEYADVPWDDPTDRGYAVQACNVSNDMGCFSELEYHVPAIGSGCHAEDVSHVWAYRGSAPAIAAVARELLGSGCNLLE